jgi:hypothetical protein
MSRTLQTTAYMCANAEFAAFDLEVIDVPASSRHARRGAVGSGVSRGYAVGGALTQIGTAFNAVASGK